MELGQLSCRQLLSTHQRGRIALNGNPSPEVVPVDYVLSDNSIYFRTGDNISEMASDGSQEATFQVDGSNPERRSSWNVMVRGHLENADASEEPEELPGPLDIAERPHLVQMSIDEMEGREVPQDQDWELGSHAWAHQDASDLMG